MCLLTNSRTDKLIGVLHNFRAELQCWNLDSYFFFNFFMGKTSWCCFCKWGYSTHLASAKHTACAFSVRGQGKKLTPEHNAKNSRRQLRNTFLMGRIYYEKKLECKRFCSAHIQKEVWQAAVTSGDVFHSFPICIWIRFHPKPQRHTALWEQEEGKTLQAAFWILYVREEKSLFQFLGVKSTCIHFPSSHALSLEAQSTLLSS